MKYLKYTIVIILPIVIWTSFVSFGRLNGFLLKSIASSENPEVFIDAVKEKTKNEYVGNIAIALVKDGKIEKDYYYSNDKPVNKYTLFQMASVSKWITAWGIFELFEQGKLNLDEPINTYLTRWQLPKSEFNNQDVTIRKLLSHTAGLTDGLGYDGFDPNKPIQSIEESLTMAIDAESSESGVTKVGIKPGSQFKYSGGGYTILQLIIEEVSGLSFQDYMKKNVFEPLKMEHSTFMLTDNQYSNFAQSYNMDGTIATHYKYTALAAASLYTCIDDLSLFLKANGSENTILSKQTQTLMNKEYAFINGKGIHGLGPFNYGSNDKGDYIIGHDGSNRPAINTVIRFNTRTKDGIIILSSGNPNLASRLGDEWIFWKTGIFNYTILNSNRKNIFSWLIVGNVIIISLLIYIFQRKRKRRKGNKV